LTAVGVEGATSQPTNTTALQITAITVVASIVFLLLKVR
jgi:hypothetical protein